MSVLVDDLHVENRVLRLVYKPVNLFAKGGIMHCYGRRFKYCISYKIYFAYVRCIHLSHRVKL